MSDIFNRPIDPAIKALDDDDRVRLRTAGLVVSVWLDPFRVDVHRTDGTVVGTRPIDDALVATAPAGGLVDPLLHGPGVDNPVDDDARHAHGVISSTAQVNSSSVWPPSCTTRIT